MQEVSEVTNKMPLDDELYLDYDKNESLGGVERNSDNGANRASSPSIQGIEASHENIQHFDSH